MRLIISVGCALGLSIGSAGAQHDSAQHGVQHAGGGVQHRDTQSGSNQHGGVQRSAATPRNAEAEHISVLPKSGASGSKAGDTGAKPAGDADPDASSLELFKPVAALAAEWVKRPELQHSVVGLEIMDVSSGRVLFSHNGRKRLVTASTAKILTTACAYDSLGADYKYKTSLLGYGDIHSSRLTGPLVILPSQDPSLTSEDVHQLIAGLDNKVKFINGRVLVAAGPGGGDHFHTEWLAQDWGQDWMPVSSDFVIDRNVVSGRDPGRGYPLVTITSDGESNAMLRGLLQSTWAPGWVQFNKSNNTVQYYRPDQPVSGGLVVANPSEYNAAVVRSMLKSQNIKVDGHDIAISGDPIDFAEHYSKPLSALVRFTLKESDNLYAQQLLRTVGTLPVASKNLENSALEERGLARMNTWLVNSGVTPGEVVIWDACGLSRKNAITPHALNTVLRHMAGPTGNGPYTDLLTHEGEGTARTWRYKTGSMDSVRSVAGIVKTVAGQPMAVTAIINDHAPSVRELRTSLAALISRLECLGSVKFTAVVEKKPPTKGKARHARSGKRGRHIGTRT